MSTGNDILDLARDLLKDTQEPYRHTDEKLVRHLNLAIGDAFRIRPDLFLASDFEWTSFSTGSLAGDMPTPVQYDNAMANYVAGYTEMSDDEFTLDGRANALMQMFRNEMLGIEAMRTG